MKKKTKKVHLSDAYIDKEYDAMGKRKPVVEEVDAYNAEAEKKALERFLKGPAGELETVVRLISEELQLNIQRVRDGKAPQPLNDFLANSLQRALGTRTYTEYKGKAVPYGFAAETDENKVIDAGIADLRAEVYGCELSAIPKLHQEWQEMVKDLFEFLYAGAVFAKSIGSSSARLYIRAWRIVEGVVAPSLEWPVPYPWQEFSADDAQRIVRLERVATERLRADAMLADLPAFPEYVRKAKKASRRERTHGF